MLRMERWVLRRFDTVSTISNRIVEQLIAKGVKPERTCYRRAHRGPSEHVK
ncbi:MAG: glycosyltransferase [Steroidobacteraceae bacterium]